MSGYSGFLSKRRIIGGVSVFCLALVLFGGWAQAGVTELPGAEEDFIAVSPQGFGDRQNSLAWAMQWWNGKLYVGTVRAFLCVGHATIEKELGFNVYPVNDPDVECTPDPADLDLRAEIWRYTPETMHWDMVYRSPADVPIPGSPGKFTARDIGYRGMTVFGNTLYVAGTSARSMFDGMPPPRLLMSTDGTTFTPVPQDPGTFLGDLPVQSNERAADRSFRSILEYDGRFFMTCVDLKGAGVLLESSDPSVGNNSFRQVSPPNMNVFQSVVFNGFLYLGIGGEDGYAVVKTKAVGDPYTYVQVVGEGGYKPFGQSQWVVSMAEYKGSLYVGTDRPTELIRIHKNDTWDLIAGWPRRAPAKWKAPKSGKGQGLGNIFTGHFWRMVVHNGQLYLGTWDRSTEYHSIRWLPQSIKEEMGFDLYTTTDGVEWYRITRTGLGDKFNYGCRTLASTPWGLFLGTANPYYGTTIYLAPW